MYTSLHLRPAGQRGISLIEVLVGLAIGMIGMLVIFQTLTVWDARTRATTSGGDAQVTGTIAMYNLERDIRLAGLGFGSGKSGDLAPELGCTVSGWDNTASAAKAFTLVPVRIIDGDPGNQPDGIVVLYGNSPYYVDRDEFTTATANSVETINRNGFKAGDIAVVTNGGTGVPASATCNFVQITDDSSGANQKTLRFDLVAYADFYQNGASVPAPRFTAASGIGAGYVSGSVYSLGPIPHLNNWSIVNDTLGFADDFQLSQFFGVAEGVVDLKAQYGYDADNDNRIDDTEWTKTLPVPTDWTRVRAIRLAMLIRSRNFERPGAASSAEQNYSAANPVWAAASTAFVMRNVDGTADSHAAGDPDPNNWRNYRYVVYEKIVPLRNVIWGLQ